MKLSYKAVANTGEVVTGLIDAATASEAAAYLRTKDLVPIKIAKQGRSGLSEFLPFMKSKVGAGDVVSFTRQLSSMLTSGLTLLRSLEILKSQFKNSALIELIGDLIKDIQEGASFSVAISRHPAVFSPVYIALIEASEGSGLLDEAFLRLADTLEKQQKLKSAVRSALAYPVIVIVMMGAVSMIMVIFVVPQFAALYDTLNVDLPLPTLILITVSNFLGKFWTGVLILLAIAITLFQRWYKTVDGRLIIDSLFLKIPIFGALIKKTILAEFARTLGILLASGSLVVDSLDKVSNITGNIHYENAIIDISKRIEKGVTIGDAMSLHSLFPPNLVELVRIGEQTGKLDETLAKASEYFENEVDQTVKTLATAMEPFILIILGIGVAFLIIAILTPIYQITNSIK